MQFFNLDKEVIQSTLFPVLIPIQLPVGYGQVNSDSNSLIVREPILIIIVNKWISTAGFYTVLLMMDLHLLGERHVAYNSRFSTVGPVRASALIRPGGANSLGPVAPSPKSWRCVSTVRPEATLRFTKTCTLHAYLERCHATLSYHQQKTNQKKVTGTSVQNKHDKSGRLFAYFVKYFDPKASMFYNNKWYIDHNELIRIEN